MTCWPFLSLRRNHRYNYFQFVTICLCHRPSRESVLATEHTFIGEWCPKLNHPFITARYRITATGYTLAKPPGRTMFQLIGRRLFQRLRRRQTYTCAKISTGLMTQSQAWQIIFDLLSYTEIAFSAAKYIRSSQVSVDQIYALYRLAANLE